MTLFFRSLRPLRCRPARGSLSQRFGSGALLPQIKSVSRHSGIDRAGIIRFTAFLLALEEINNSTTLLPHTTLRYIYRDSRRDELSALKAALDFEGWVQGACQSAAALSERALDADAAPDRSKGTGVHAVIGAASSGPTMAAQEVLRYAHIPQISYSATL